LAFVNTTNIGGVFVSLHLEGSIAEPLDDNCIPSTLFFPLDLTYSEVYDENLLFKKLSKKISELELISKGSIEHLEILNHDVNKLSRNSEYRLECEIRVRSLKKKWGLINPSKVNTPAELKFPINIEEVEASLIQLSNQTYINSGKEGRQWVNNYMERLNLKTIESEKHLSKIASQALKELSNQIEEVFSAKTEVDWKEALHKINIAVNENDISNVFSLWKKAEKDRLTTIRQLKNWVKNKQENVQQDQAVMETIDGKYINHLTI
jgi:hypothetical protein